MLGYVRYGIARPLVRLWLASSQRSWRHLPTPVDRAASHAPGIDADRILLLGSGISVGYGVLSHDLALGGSLARAVSWGTGRGTDVEIVTARDMSPSAARTLLLGLNLARFDAIVLTLGGPESLYLMPQSSWRRQLRGLFDAIRDAAPRASVFFVAAPNPSALVSLPHALVGTSTAHSARLNRHANELVDARDGFHFVDFQPSLGDLATMASRHTYEEWAGVIAPTMVARLAAQLPVPPEWVDEGERQRALMALEVRREPDERFDRIVETARDLFEATGASLNFIDGDHEWVKAAIGLPKGELPRTESLCDIAIRRSGLFLVEDLWSDSRFASMPWARSTGTPRFYAGYPVTAPDGHRIGALCVIDRKPRTFADTEAALLRELALRVQALLWNDAEKVGSRAP